MIYVIAIIAIVMNHKNQVVLFEISRLGDRNAFSSIRPRMYGKCLQVRIANERVFGRRKHSSLLRDWNLILLYLLGGAVDLLSKSGPY